MITFPSPPTVVGQASFVSGSTYAIKTVGTTNWTSIGALAATIGTIFVYNGVTVTGSDGDAWGTFSVDWKTWVWTGSRWQLVPLGTASTRNVPESGNAASTEVVLGSDTRLTGAMSVLATGSSASRTLANRFSDVINVLDFGAHSITETGYETFDSTTAIQAAIDFASTSPKKIVFIPGGAYKVTSTITIPDTTDQQGLLVIGAGKANGSGLVSQGVSTIYVDHTNGVGVKIQGSNTVLQYIQVRGSDTRRDSGNLNLHGVLLEALDQDNYGVRTAWIHGCSIRGHSGNGLVTSGNCVQTKIEDITIRQCKGHGFVLNDGTITGRTFKDRPGMVDIINCRTFDVSGHSVLAGTGETGTYGAYRLRIENFETGSHTTDYYNAAILKHLSQMWLHGENIFVERCAFDGAYNSTPTLGGLYISGKTNRITSNRFVGVTGQAVYVGIDNPTQGTLGTTIDGMYVDTTSGTLSYGVYILTGSLGTIVINTSTERITNPAGGDLSSLITFSQSGSFESSATIVAKKFTAQNATSSDTIEANRANSAVGIKIERTGTGATTGRLDCIGGTFQVSSDTNLVLTKTSGKSITVKSNTINMASLPTSNAGLVSGDLWNNSGVLNIIT
jgi:hypothetical protein